jgi:acetyl-CoA carboxylase carboxyltransferase component
MTRTIEDKISLLTAYKQKAMAGGGPERVMRHHAAGKMTARERINALFDRGTFAEIDMFTMPHGRSIEDEGPVGEGVVTGHGLIDGRLCYAYAQDFTVVGGSVSEAHSSKMCRIMDMALDAGVPLIGLNDSGGARIQEGVSALDGVGQIFYRNTLASGVIPQLCVIMGPCAGGAVYSPALMDFVIMVDKTSEMFITGPQVIKAVTGEEITGGELGGAHAHNKASGVAHFFAHSETEALNTVQRLLSYLPSNNVEDPPTHDWEDPPDRASQCLREIVPVEPHKPYDIRDVILEVVDGRDFLEIHQYYAPNMVIGLARINARVVGIVANQPSVLAGCLDIDASDKAARFVRFCDAFNVPLVVFVDTPGYLPGVAQEHGGIIRHGAKLLYAFSEATVPKVTVILRKAYGGAYIGMCSRSLRADRVIAWPTAEVAVMGPEGAANIIYKDEIANAQDPENVRQKRIEEYRERFANPYVAASRGYIDTVIDPQDTRMYIALALSSLATKRQTRPAKKHGNFPV